MEEVKTRLEKKADWYRPLFITLENKGDLELGNIKIYDKNGVIFDLGYGYFDKDEEMTINGNVIYKLKEDFSKKINYVIPKKEECYSKDKKYSLYIYVGNVEFKYIGLKKEWQNVYKKYLLNGVEVGQCVAVLSTNVYRYKTLIDEQVSKIKSYALPLKQTEIEDICKKIAKYNQLIIEEKQWLEDYEPTEEDLLDNFKTVMKRDI